MLNGLFHRKCLGNTPSFRSLECFLRLAYERIVGVGFYHPMADNVTLVSGIKMKPYAINFFHFLSLWLVSKAETAMTDKFQESARLFLQDC